MMQNNKRSQNKSSHKLFIVAFMLILVVVVLNNIKRSGVVLLPVQDNAGVSFLETTDDSLVCVFQDGQVCSWGWDNLPVKDSEFSVQSNWVCLLDGGHIAAVNKVGTKMLSIFDFLSGQKTNEIKVGWEDQEVWPRISFGKGVLAAVRRNTANKAGELLFDFLAVDLKEEKLGFPVSVTIQADSEDFIDYAVSSKSVVYAVGSSDQKGRIVAVDLGEDAIVWDQDYDESLEFCSVIVSPGDQYVLAGNRDGKLYKIDSQTGQIIKMITLLEEGETRTITNDFSVRNLAFSPDGRYYAATINPPVYVLEAASDTLIKRFSPANKLVSKVAFSPDNEFIATSDIRAGWPIKVWTMSELEK